MASVRTRTSERTERTTLSRRERVLPFEDHVLDFRNDDPDLFERYQPHAIARGLANRMYPKDLPHLNVVIELMESNLQTFRRRYDPNFDVDTGGGQTPRSVTTPSKGEMHKALLEDITLDTVFNGKPLRAWTFGEFRRLHKNMASILKQFANVDDDELIGDHWKD